ncbi:MAG: peptidyl-prolyl cis-trans isomerase [Bacteroidota bacterium]
MTYCNCHTEESVYRFPLFFFSLLLLLVIGCTEPEQNGSVVARVNNQSLTMEMIKANVDPSRTLTQNDIQQYASRWVTNELLYQEAQQRGYDVSEQIQQKMTEARKQLSIAELLEKEVYSLASNDVRRDELAAYFQNHSDEFILRESIIRLSVVIFNEFESANQFRTETLNNGEWDKTIEQFRSNPSKGLLSYSDSLFYTKSSLYPQELWKVAGALGMSEVSFPVKTSVGHVVLRSLGQFKESSISPLQYVETDIRNRLAMERRQKKYQQFLQELRMKHTVTMMIAGTDSTKGMD